MKFSLYDIRQIKAQGQSIAQIEKQIETFQNGIKPVKVVSAATLANGIEAISEADRKKLIDKYEDEKGNLQIVKFVPASGAATRMFKFLHRFLTQYQPKEEKIKSFLSKSSNKNELITFFENRKHFAFYNKWKRKCKKIYPYRNTTTKGMRWFQMASVLLGKEGLNYGNLPKGLISFHSYKQHAATAFEEQLFEAAFYASVEKEVFVHFTFSEEHVKKFKKKYKKIQPLLKRKTGANFNISYSFQKKETDTITVTPDNKIIRNSKGELIFRPSGHGALLQNLNEIDADLVFIKNIDNVITRNHINEIAHYKKLLAGKLLWLQENIFRLLNKLDTNQQTETVIEEARSFLFKHLSIKNPPKDLAQIRTLLNRPIRVCGMVKNTGAPGGGPFWVKDENEKISLQIVELSQINTSNPNQKAIVNSATHFNPVDIVCGLRNYKGDKFDLQQFTNPDWKIISEKSINGNAVKALELPGLWNGAMANWNTVFVEVPLITFNPVKTVNDLLKKEHQPQL